MEAVDLTRLSSKGQVVIPGDIRTALGLETGTKFLVFGDGDTIILKKISRPSKKEIEKLFADSSKQARKAGLKKSRVKADINKIRQGA